MLPCDGKEGEREVKGVPHWREWDGGDRLTSWRLAADLTPVSWEVQSKITEGKYGGVCDVA